MGRTAQVTNQEIGLSGKGSGNRNKVIPVGDPSMKRQAALTILAKKEADLAQALRSERGLKKIAANLANPVRKHLDYVPVGRKLAVVEPWPDGMPIIYDEDIVEFTAVKIAKNGTTTMLEIEVNRVELTEFEIVTRPKVPYRELFIRRYKVLNRAKERLQQGIGLREDLNLFSLLETASIAENTVHSVSTRLTKDALAMGFTQVEKNRLIVRGVLMSAFGIQGIRRFQYQDIDEAAREEIRKTGYIGSMWGADFFISDQVTDGTVYLLAEDQFLAWIPIRKDADVIPADDPDNLLLGFVGYELLAMTVHNTKAVSKVTFDSTA